MKKITEIPCEDNACPVKKTASIIGKKWTTLIIRELLEDKKSFSQIQKALDNISPKVLTERLKFLEGKNIISRKVFPTSPPTTEYQLTKLGVKMKNVIVAMAEFGESLL